MSINAAAFQRAGESAREAVANIGALDAELNELKYEESKSGATPQLETQIAQVEKAEGHDTAVIQANFNLTQILVVEERVQEESAERKKAMAAQYQAEQADENHHAQGLAITASHV